ncbi:alpha/beta fold hydrolase [Pseudomonas sp. BIGb0164]|jgi:pimeloyl-ACP methyl ester carboxylesterase|uniref:alpha/beta fold hydrolase n=1 Tax=Pseudomonas sp. BIGb0164 TaxID=2940605 RepID=UPI000EC62914|nr:alpha/beta hydrolase [Pseudomonas sp. BIGb0164]MCS4250775.1 pimeloyl-ACP methyl ester carboxylesterase [Pseudomonas sp. BIGb0164]HCT06062.1 alpha/beta hydrolase [Pseudomonas sp.]
MFDRRGFMLLAAVAVCAPAFAVQTVSTDEQEIRYERFGPEEGHAIILLAADTQVFAAVTGPLAAQGFRVIVPYLRDSDDGTLGQDVLELMNALHIPEAVLAGVEQGARVAAKAATLKPTRCVGLVTLNTPPQPGFAEAVALMAKTGHWRT